MPQHTAWEGGGRCHPRALVLCDDRVDSASVVAVGQLQHLLKLHSGGRPAERGQVDQLAAHTNALTSQPPLQRAAGSSGRELWQGDGWGTRRGLGHLTLRERSAPACLPAISGFSSTVSIPITRPSAAIASGIYSASYSDSPAPNPAASHGQTNAVGRWWRRLAFSDPSTCGAGHCVVWTDRRQRQFRCKVRRLG